MLQFTTSFLHFHNFFFQLGGGGEKMGNLQGFSFNGTWIPVANLLQKNMKAF